MKAFFFRFLAAALAVLMVCCACAAAESYDASTMRLLRYNGEVEILDVSGNARFIMENARFASGETLITGAASGASVSLDSSKIVSLDEETKAAFAQDGGHLKLTLLEGALFLDVKEKLDENESLDIETSTMTVGIRGTIVYVSEGTVSGTGTAADPAGAATQLTVLEGTAEISYQDESGTRRMADVPAGQTAVIAHDGDALAAPVIQPTAAENISAFIQQMISDDPAIGDRIEAAGGLPAPEEAPAPAEEPFPADGDWVYTGRVTIVAQSASKLYDGNTLSRVDDALVYGLPSGLNIQVACSGSQTNAGSSTNRVSGYSIYNAKGENVTSHFNNIETVEGTLIVSPAPLTVWTGSAEKVYDGTPLTCDEAGIRTAEGHAADVETWRNSAMAATSPTGGAMMYGMSGQTWMHVTNPFTGESRDILLGAGQRLTVNYTTPDGEDPGIELVIEDVAVEDLPEEVLQVYKGNPSLMDRACADAGWDPEEMAERTEQVETGAGNAEAGLMVESVDVRLTVDTAVSSGTTRTLGNSEAQFTPVTVPASVKVTATGSQTEVGESENTYEIDWGSENKDNYTVSEELGILRVTARTAPAPETVDSAVTLTAASAEKVYDGTALTDSGVTVSGLPEGYTASATASGSQTDAGSSANTVSSYTIRNSAGQDVTGRFTSVSTVNGTLTVTEAEVTVTTESASKKYDGQPLTAGGSISGLVQGESATVTATGSITDVGSVENGYTLDWGNTNKNNYSVQEDLGILEVTENDTEITFTATTAEKAYDGTPLEATADTVTVTGLPEGFTWTVKVSGSQTGAGSSESEITEFTIHPATKGDTPDVTAFFTGAKAVKGTLTINPAEATVTTESASKTYDGEELTAPGSISGLVNGETAAVTATGSITNAGTAENGYTIDWGSTDKNNYTVTEKLGTLTVEKAELTIETGSAVRPYDGEELTAAESRVEGEEMATEKVTGLAAGDDVTVTANGSITHVGSVTNGYEISWEDTDPNNYTVTEKLGTLEITTNDMPIVVTAPTQTEEYDGTALTPDPEMAVRPELPGDLWCDFDVTGSQTDVGESASKIVDFRIGDSKEEDVTAYFTNITLVDGKLTVTPLTDLVTVTLTGNSNTVKYNGSEQSVSGYTVSIDNDLYTENDFTYTGETAAKGTDAGGYAMGLLAEEFENTSPNFSNVAFVVAADGLLNIDPRSVNLTSATDSKKYDGTALTAPEVEIGGDGFVDGEVSSVRATGSVTNVAEGKVSNTIEFTPEGSFAEGNYIITEMEGTLEITPRSVTLTSSDMTKVYDGTPLDNGEVTVGGDGFAPGEGATYDFTETITNVDTSPNDFTRVLNANTAETNYSFNSVTGTLSVTPRNVTLTSGDGEKWYDGTPLTADTVTVGGDGFVEGQGATCTVTGSLTEPGEGPNTFSYTLNSGTSENNYNITKEEGVLWIRMKHLIVYLGGQYIDYDGEYHGFRPNAVSIVYGIGPSEGQTASCVCIEGDGNDVEEATFSCSLDSGETFTMRVYVQGGAIYQPEAEAHILFDLSTDLDYYMIEREDDIVHIVYQPEVTDEP